MRRAAQQDLVSFLDRLELPVLIDEAQYVPNLFSYMTMVWIGKTKWAVLAH